MPAIKNLRINFDMDNKQALVINNLNTTNTLKDLKQIIVDKELQNKSMKDVKLIFKGKPLSDDTKTLAQYNIRSNRAIIAIIRVTGGSQGEDSIVINEEALKKLDVRVVKDHCNMNIQESCTSDGTKRIRMPECNYKCTYCIPCLKKRYKKCIEIGGSTDVTCGYGNDTDPDNLDTCKGSVLDIDRIFVALSLNEDDQTKCFHQINKNGMKNDPSVISCPGCECYVFKENINHNRVRCIRKNCPLKKDWCWSCQGTWKSETSNYKICGNDNCGDSDLAIETDLLLNCPRVYINHDKIGNVPSIRMCPMCDRIVEYTSGCKHLTCPNNSCKHQFCIVCVEKWKTCNCNECKLMGEGNVPTCNNGIKCKIKEPSELI